jgi:uncharacterized protein involved in cysteine biosynthesis
MTSKKGKIKYLWLFANQNFMTNMILELVRNLCRAANFCILVVWNEQHAIGWLIHAIASVMQFLYRIVACVLKIAHGMIIHFTLALV